MRVGHILDAQDYFEQWYLAIVIDLYLDEDASHLNAQRKFHFLPFSKNSKRDEIFLTKDLQVKVAPAFSKSERIENPIKSISSLRDYA